MEAPQRFQNCGERKDISDNGVALCVFQKIMSILLMLCDILDDGLTDADLISASVDVIYALYQVAMAGLPEGKATRVMGGDTPNFEPSRILDYWDIASLPNPGLLDHDELSGNLGITEGADHCGGRQMHGQTLLRPKAILPQLGFGGAKLVEHSSTKESSHSTFHSKQPEKSGKACSKALKLSGSGARTQNNLNVANVQENISELFYSMERERNVKYDLLESLDWDNTFSGAGLLEPEELSRIIEELKAVYPLQGSNVKHVSGSLKPTTPMTPSKSSSASSTVTTEEDSGVLSSCGRASGRLEHVSSKESSHSTFHSKQPEKSGKACSKVLKAPTSQHKRISNGYVQVRKSNNPETYTAERRVAHESTSKFAPVSSAVTVAASSAPCSGGISGSSSSMKCRLSPSKVNRTLKLPLASSNHNSGAKVGSKGKVRALSGYRKSIDKHSVKLSPPLPISKRAFLSLVKRVKCQPKVLKLSGSCAGKHYYLDNKSNMASDEENNSELSYSMELNRNDRYDLTEGLDWDNTFSGPGLLEPEELSRIIEGLNASYPIQGQNVKSVSGSVKPTIPVTPSKSSSASSTVSTVEVSGAPLSRGSTGGSFCTNLSPSPSFAKRDLPALQNQEESAPRALKQSGFGARMQNTLIVANDEENRSELFYSVERESNVKYDLLESLDWDDTFSGAGLLEPEELSRIIEEVNAVYPLQGSNVKPVSGSLKPTMLMTPSKSSSASSTVTTEEDSDVHSSCGRASGRLEHVSSKESSHSTFHSKQPEKSGKACSKVLNGYVQVRKSNNPETYTAERRVAHESTSKFALVSSTVTAAASSAPCPGGISGSSSSVKRRSSPSKVNRTLKLPLASSNHNSGAKVGLKGKHYYLDNKSNMASDEENNSELSYSMELNRNDGCGQTEGLDWDNIFSGPGLLEPEELSRIIEGLNASYPLQGDNVKSVSGSVKPTISVTPSKSSSASSTVSTEEVSGAPLSHGSTGGSFCTNLSPSPSFAKRDLPSLLNQVELAPKALKLFGSELFYPMERERNVKNDLLESLDWDNTFSGAGLLEPEELSRIIEEVNAVYPLQRSNVKPVSGSLKPTMPMTPSISSSASSTVTTEGDSAVLSSCGRASGRLEHVNSKESSHSNIHSKQPEKSGKTCSKVTKEPTSQHKRTSNGYVQVRKSNNPESYTVAGRRVAHESTPKFALVSSTVTLAPSSAPYPGDISGSSSSMKRRSSPSKVNRKLKLPLASSNHNSGANVRSKGKVETVSPVLSGYRKAIDEHSVKISPPLTISKRCFPSLVKREKCQPNALKLSGSYARVHINLDNMSSMASDEEINSELSYSVELNRNDKYDLTESLDWDDTFSGPGLLEPEELSRISEGLNAISPLQGHNVKRVSGLVKPTMPMTLSKSSSVSSTVPTEEVSGSPFSCCRTCGSVSSNLSPSPSIAKRVLPSLVTRAKCQPKALKLSSSGARKHNNLDSLFKPEELSSITGLNADYPLQGHAVKSEPDLMKPTPKVRGLEASKLLNIARLRAAKLYGIGKETLGTELLKSAAVVNRACSMATKASTKLPKSISTADPTSARSRSNDPRSAKVPGRQIDTISKRIHPGDPRNTMLRIYQNPLWVHH